MQSLSAYTMSLTSQAVACKDLSSWLTAMGRHLLGDCFVARVPCSCVVFERVPCWQQVWKPNYQGLAHDTLMQLVRARALCKAGVTVLPIWGCPGNNVHFPAHVHTHASNTITASTSRENQVTNGRPLPHGCYALSIYLPISVICIVPSDIARWVVVLLGTVTSGLFLFMNLRERIMAAGPG
eukprot:scaffold41199_cov22-Tisochrysis_lutea.AAC.1